MLSLSSDLALALDPVRFARSLAFEPDAWQAEALRWPGTRALWNCCRQAGKSTIASLLAVHRALYHPASLVLLVSPSLRQSSELFRKVAGWIGALSVTLREDNKLSCVLENDSRIVSLPSSEATIRGFSSVDLVIFDEAARVEDELYIAVRPMLAVSGGKLLGMSTPFGKRGWWFEAWTSGGAEWSRVEIPATQCPRITPAFLEQEREALGEWWFKQEYLCQFAETAEQVFNHDIVMSAITKDVRPLFAGGRA